MDGLFPTIFHGERSELREKYRLVTVHPPHTVCFQLIVSML
jgi:hypothetical protein